MTSVEVSFIGEEFALGRGESLTFGREADLVIDSNPYLHRMLGRISVGEDVWWLTNTGSAISLHVYDDESTSTVTVAPSAGVPISFARCVVRFAAGAASYELLVESSVVPDLAEISVDVLGNSTVTSSQVPLNEEERVLLIALSQERLRDRSAPTTAIPTNRALADELAWTSTKFNRKLDRLCEKLQEAGVKGLKGDAGALARHRRERLVDYAIGTGVVSIDDLGELGQYCEKFSRGGA